MVNSHGLYFDKFTFLCKIETSIRQTGSLKNFFDYKGDRKVDEREIIRRVSGRINPQNVEFLIWYGDWVGDDIDLMAVLKQKIRARPYEPSKLDISTIGKDEFQRRLKFFDPLVTEPLITGALLSGDEAEFGELRSETILSLSLTKEAIQFLRQKAQQRLESALARLEIYGQKKDKRILLSSLVNLSFACSYYEYARYYENEPKFLPITFTHLLAEDGKPLLKEVMKTLKTLKTAKSGRKFNKEEVIDLFKRTQELLGAVK